MNRVMVIPFLSLLAVLNAHPAASQPYTVRYEASSGTTPDQICPNWAQFGNVATVSGGLLHIATGSNSANSYYAMNSARVSIPDPWVIEFRCKLISGSSSHVASAPIVVGASTAPNVGAGFLIAPGEIFLHSASLVKGPAASVATTDAMHTYRLRISGGVVQVFYDGVLTLTGATYADASNWPGGPFVDWGEEGSLSTGVSDWEYFQHNASLTPCIQVAPFASPVVLLAAAMTMLAMGGWVVMRWRREPIV